MARYETHSELQAAVEKRLKKSLATQDWDCILPENSPPYDDYDLREVLAAYAEEPKDTKEFVEDCQRIGKLVSYDLERLHRSETATYQLLQVTGVKVRPLGEFWSWSWLYAIQDQTSVISKRAFTPNGYIELGPSTNFQYASTTAVLGTWEFFWSAVETLTRQYRSEPCQTVASIFWPDTFPGWSRKLWPLNEEPRSECVAQLRRHGATKVRGLRDAMEQRSLRLYKPYVELGGTLFTNDPTKMTLNLIDSAATDSQWETRRLLYEVIRQSADSFGDMRPIATREQFRVETTRTRDQSKEHARRVAERENLSYEIGPRWYMDGTLREKPPEVPD